MMEASELEQPQELLRSYHVDLRWYEQTYRSLAVLVGRCLCPSCQVRLAGAREEQLLATLQEHCSDLPDYRSPRLPLMEILFRILLAHGNEAVSLKQLQQEAAEWTSAADGRDVSPAILRRLLDADTFYGIRPLPDHQGSEAQSA